MSTQIKKIVFSKSFHFLLFNSFTILLVAFLNLKGLYRAPFLGLLLFSVLVTVAFRYPLVAIQVFLITAVGPEIFQMVKIIPSDFLVIGGGFNLPDVFLLAMAGALFFRMFQSSKQKQILGIPLSILVTVFMVLLLFEVLRNFSKFGLSAPGEFRYRYLILVLPLYISIFLENREQRKILFRMIITFSVVITLMAIPLIGILKGWEVGPQSRFFSSSISLGLVYGLVAMFLANKYALIIFQNNVLWLIVGAVLTITLIDSHRSVWLASSTILIVLFLLKEINLDKAWKWAVPVALLFFLVWQISSESGLDVIEYIQQRGGEIVNPGEKSTAAWRLAIWEAQFKKFLQAPLLGHGFGGYWEVYVPQFKAKLNFSPHSLYIQSLVKIGLIGLGLYFLIMLKLFFIFKQWLKKNQHRVNPEKAIVLTSLMVVVGAHVFYSVYAFEHYTMFFLGLGVAVIRDQREESET